MTNLASWIKDYRGNIIIQKHRIADDRGAIALEILRNALIGANGNIKAINAEDVCDLAGELWAEFELRDWVLEIPKQEAQKILTGEG
jgi:phosphopantothenate synthetase